MAENYIENAVAPFEGVMPGGVPEPPQENSP